MYHVVDEAGKDDAKGRIAHGTPDGFGNLVKCFPDCRVAFDASMNCRWLCEILELQMPAEDSGLANPYKTRLIDEAQIKTD